MKFYVAGSTKIAALVREVQYAISLAGHDLTYDWTHHGDAEIWTPIEATRIASAMINVVLASDFIVACFPGGKGTHIEIGAALAASKPLILVRALDTGLPTLGDSMFYRHPRITWIDAVTLADLVRSLPSVIVDVTRQH